MYAIFVTYTHDASTQHIHVKFGSSIDKARLCRFRRRFMHQRLKLTLFLGCSKTYTHQTYIDINIYATNSNFTKAEIISVTMI